MNTQLFEILSGALLYNVIPKSAQMSTLVVLTHCQMTRIHVQIRRFACCLDMGLNLKMLKMSWTCYLHRGSYMSAHVLLNYLTSWGKEIKCEVLRISNKQIKLNLYIGDSVYL